MTAHDASVVRVMQDRAVSQEAAERIVWETTQIAQLRMRLNNEQRYDGQTLVSGLTDEQIDAQAEELQRGLIAGR